MATSNSVDLTARKESSSQTFKNESVSFVSGSGDQNSYRAVPAGAYWELQTLRATNGDTVDREITFKLVDAGGTTHAVLSPTGARQTVGAGEEASWVGKIIVPELWTVRAYWYGLASGKTCTWQYTAIEYAAP